MNKPPVKPSKILFGEQEICNAFQIGRRRLAKWRERGLPVKIIDGRLTGNYDAIEIFISQFVTHQNDSQ